MNLIPRRFTALSDAISYATLTNGIVYKFGNLYKVYTGNTPQPMGCSACWSSPTIGDDTLIQWLNVI